MGEPSTPWVVLRREDLEELLVRAVQRGRELGTGEPEWLTAEQVAEALGVKRETVVTYARREGMPHAYAGKRLMVRRDRLHAWLEERSQREGSRRPVSRPTLRPIKGGR
jgi:excisionase family DNA binding protein